MGALNSVSPLLNAFGNATTLKNRNSSRYAKFVEVIFDSKPTPFRILFIVVFFVIIRFTLGRSINQLAELFAILCWNKITSRNIIFSLVY